MQKECICITSRKQNIQHRLSPNHLAELIRGAQCDVQHNIDELCRAFRPLIYKESKRETVYNALGEDAVSIAWEIFLKFIRRYNGCDYVNLPGLIRCHLRYELLHAVQKQGALWDNEDLSTMEEGTEASGVADVDRLNHTLLKLALDQESRRFSPACRKLMQVICTHNCNNTKAASILQCTEGNIRYYKNYLYQKLVHLSDNAA